MQSTRLRELKTSDLAWEIRLHPEDRTLKGNLCDSGNPTLDARVEAGVQKRLDAGDQWAWCQVELVGTFAGMEVTEWLCEVSCLDEADFKRGGYYEDMQESVLQAMQAWLDNLCDLLDKENGDADGNAS